MKGLINTSVIMCDLLAVHCHTSWHPVATCHGIWEKCATKSSHIRNTTLSKVRDSVEEALVQSAPVMLTCFGHREC